jgi:hypothetical protein
MFCFDFYIVHGYTYSLQFYFELVKRHLWNFENCHDGDLGTIDTAQYQNNEWICKFKEVDCGKWHWCDGSDGMCKDQQMKLTTSDDKNYYYFGYQQSISDDVLVAGTWSEAAYVFEKGDDNIWMQTAKLNADDGASDDDLFGHSVDVFGDTIIVGASYDKSGIGAAYIFSRPDGDIWTQTAKITASDGASDDYFGSAVAASEDLVVVRASSFAYFFERDTDGGNWTESGKLNVGRSPDDEYGALSISGNVLAVGAPQSALVYERNPIDGNWLLAINLTSPIHSSSDGFGTRVSVDGDVVVVGAMFSDVNKGAAYVFETNVTTDIWELTATLTADDGSENDQFGSSVAVSNGTIVVGAPNDNSRTGSVYVFQKTASDEWALVSNITAKDASSGDDFGFNVGLSGGVIAVGAPNDDSRNGSVYVNLF